LKIITGSAALICPLYAATDIRAGALITSCPSWNLARHQDRRGFQTPAGSAKLGDSAVAVVEGATPATPVTGAITMLIVGILLNIVGLGVLCWALLTLAVHALPFFVGMIAGLYAYQNGVGPFGAIVVGFAAASFTLVVGQYAFSVARSPVIRPVIGLLFALPGARAGYDATLGLAHIGAPSGWWREAFAIFGAIIVGCTAWARVSILTGLAPGGGATLSPAQSPIGRSEQGRVTPRVRRLRVGASREIRPSP
jgi:hypothetical protein